MINDKKEIGIWLQVNYNKLVDEIWCRVTGSNVDEAERVDIIEEHLRSRLAELNLDDAIRSLTEELKLDCTGRGYCLFYQLVKEMYEQDCWEYASEEGRKIRKEIAERYCTTSKCMETNIRYMMHKLNPEDVKNTLCINPKRRISCRDFFDAVMLYLK